MQNRRNLEEVENGLDVKKGQCGDWSMIIAGGTGDNRMKLRT